MTTGRERGHLHLLSDAPSEPIGRREALRRAALAGGTVAWAVPLVQLVGSRGAAAVSAPPPPPPPPFHGISYVGIVFTCGTTVNRLKWEAEGGWNDFGGAGLPHCTPPSGWDTAVPYAPATNVVVATNFVGGELYQATFTLPVGCQFASGASGVAKGGKPPGNGYCAGGVVSGDARSITFTAPPK